MYNRHSILRISFLMAGFLLCGNAWSAQAGLVQFVHGDVTVTDVAGTSRAARKGAAINEGDTLVSAQNASAQIRMDDGGFIAIRPNTRLKFDKFKFTKQQDKPESAFFSLFKGGFRAITGLIGRIRHEDYKISTSAATIGIRGTDHETVMVLPDDPLVLAGQAVPGAYNKVNVGETTITTNKGTITVLPNQMGFAGGLNQMPQIRPVNTNLFSVTPTPTSGAQPGSGGESGGESGTRDTAVVDNTPQTTGGDSGDATGSSSPGTSAGVTGTAPPSVVVTPTQALSSGSSTLPTQAAGGIAYFDGPISSGYGDIVHFTPSATGGLGTFTSTAYGMSGNIGSASLLEQGSNVLAGNIHWGRWFGAGATMDYGRGPAPFGGDAQFSNSNLTYIGGDVPTMPVTGTATYIPIGGTSPVDALGNTGSFLGANVTVMFANSAMTVSNLRVAFAGNTYTMAGSGTFASNGVIAASPLSGTCAGSTCGVAVSGVPGDFAGAFTGTNAVGLGLVYHISPANVDIVGAQGFVKQ